ncbi:MAG: rod shape-determining protein MreC [Candidatus Babeliales bacterium]
MAPLLKKIIILVCLVGLTFFVAQRAFFFDSAGIFEQCAARINYPFMRVATMVTDYVHRRAERQLSYQDLSERYRQLLDKYNNVCAQNIQLWAMQHHESMSKELREFAQRYSLQHLVLARIVVRNFSEHEQYVLINRGAKHGITKDMVALYKFQILGKVTEVFEDYSKLSLITDDKCKVAAYTATSDAVGIVQGGNGVNKCLLQYVGHIQEVHDYDLVLSSGQGLIFPEGFCLGRIKRHELKEHELYHIIEVEPLYDMRTIQCCLLLNRAQLNLF